VIMECCPLYGRSLCWTIEVQRALCAVTDSNGSSVTSVTQMVLLITTAERIAVVALTQNQTCVVVNVTVKVDGGNVTLVRPTPRLTCARRHVKPLVRQEVDYGMLPKMSRKYDQGGCERSVLLRRLRVGTGIKTCCARPK